MSLLGISKGRWLHHTSFLWNFDAKNMKYLQNPHKQPQYRMRRDHEEFLCKLDQIVTSKEHFYQAARKQLEMNFDVQEVTEDAVQHILLQEHRQSTKWIQPE